MIYNDERLQKLKETLINATPHDDVRAEVEGLFLYLEQLELFVECYTTKYMETGEE